MEGNSEVVYVYMDGAEGGAVDAESLSQVIQMTTDGDGQQQMVYVLENVDENAGDSAAEAAQFSVETQHDQQQSTSPEAKGAIDGREDDQKQGNKTKAQNKSSIAVQANDYEIERRSGVVPSRKRVIPAKFRDYQNALSDGEGSDEDYNPSLENDSADKKIRRTTGVRTGRKPGRPKKVRVDHSYEKSDELDSSEMQPPNTGADALQETPKAVHMPLEGGASTTGAYTPRRGRPPKELSAPAGVKNFKCLTCDKRFSQKGNLKAHMKTHTDERPFACDIVSCKKTFRTNESLKRHKMAHLGIKLFECDICKQKFSSNVALTEHTARHTDSKPHKCEECGRMFRQISCFKRHLITHKSETPFECQICGKKFSQMIYLKSHTRSHTGERPYKCQICQRAFSHQSDLNRHQVTHQGNKPYGCDVCGARFSDPSSRRRHVKEHSGFKPYTCQLCTETFKRAGQLKAHLNKKHMDLKDEVVISRTGPHQTMEFQFKNAVTMKESQTGVDQRMLEAQREFVRKVTQGAAAQQKHSFVLQSDASSSGSNINLEGSQSGEYHPLTEETQRIIQQIQTQLASQAANQPDGQPLQVAYQIIHDDDNQQVLEIQYHQTMEVTGSAAAEPDAQSGGDRRGEAEEEGPAAQDEQHEQEDVAPDLQLKREAVELQGETQTLAPPDDEVAELPVQNYELTNAEETDGNVRQRSVHQSPDTEMDEESENAVDVGSAHASLMEADKVAGIDYVSNPDFNSQAYYNWLTNFAELCKLVPVPLDVDLFQKISQVYKSLSDVLAVPSGILSNKENFQILMNISKDLNSIITEHLGFVLKNLNEQE